MRPPALCAGPVLRRVFHLLAAFSLPFSALAQLSFLVQPPATAGNYPGQRVQAQASANLPGSTPFAVQWQKDGVNLSNSPHYQGAVTVANGLAGTGGSTFVNGLFIIPDVQASDTGDYRAILYAGGLSITSSVCHIAPISFVSKAPVIRSPAPADATVPVGTSFVTFRTQVTASPDTTYQWYKDGVAFGEERAANSLGYYAVRGSVSKDGDGFFDFVVSPVTAGAAGSYVVVLSNALGTATSAPIHLSIVPGTAPSITKEPAQTLVVGNLGDTVHITGYAASGNPSPAYYYSKDGGPMVQIIGGDLALYYLQPGDAGVYTVIASNSVSSVAFSPVTVSMGAPTGSTHTPTPVPCIGSEDQIRGATLRANVFFGQDDHPNPNTYEMHFAASGNTFTIPAGGYLPAQTANWSLDLTGAYGKDAYGNAVPTINVFGLKDEANESVTAHFYLFCDDNHLDVWYDLPAKLVHHFAYYTWDSLPAAAAGPVITLQPAPTSAVQGTTTMLQVIAVGTEPLSYQWQKGGQDLPGETHRTLTLANVSPANAGNYRVKVTNGAQTTVISKQVALTVNPSLPPSINTQPQSGDYYEGEAAALSAYLSLPNGNVGPIYPPSIPAQLQWLKDGQPVKTVSGPFSSLDLIFGLGLKADNGFYYIRKSDAGVYTAVASINGSATNSAPAAIRVVNDQDAPVFRPVRSPFNLTNGSGLVIEAEVVGTQDPTQKARLQINRVTYQWKKDGAMIPGATRPYYQIQSLDASQAGSYTLVATGLTGAATESAPILVNLVDPCLPPANDAALRGSSFWLSKTADKAPFPAGVIPLRFDATGNGYQVLTTADHAGFTGTWTSQTFGTSYLITLNGFTYTDGKVGAASLTLYCASGLLSYSLSQSASPYAYLSGDASTKAPPATKPTPHIETQPAAVSATEGQSASLTVTASVSDGSPITYQWKKAAAPVPGATQPTLTFNPIGVGDAGVYTVDVTANGQTATSNPAQVTVLPKALSAISIPPKVDLSTGFPISIPTDLGRNYQVQFSENGGQKWTASLPVIAGTGSPYLWIDNGPPRTTAAPTTVPARIYRVVLVP